MSEFQVRKVCCTWCMIGGKEMLGAWLMARRGLVQASWGKLPPGMASSFSFGAHQRKCGCARKVYPLWSYMDSVCVPSSCRTVVHALLVFLALGAHAPRNYRCLQMLACHHSKSATWLIRVCFRALTECKSDVVGFFSSLLTHLFTHRHVENLPNGWFVFVWGPVQKASQR